MFAGLCLGEFLHVYITCLSVDALDFNIRFQTGFFHLQQNKSASHGNSADVMPRRCLDSYNITFFKRNLV